MNDHIKSCPICQQSIVGEPQKTWRGETFYIYTCRNIHCESGIREITLDEQGLDELTVEKVRTFPMPRTAHLKAQVS